MKTKLFFGVMIMAAAASAGYYFGRALPEKKTLPAEAPEVGAVQPAVPPEAGSSPEAELMETELAGHDTCTVLPPKLELADGALCEVVDETPFMVEDEPANYQCSDGSWLAGTPDRDEKLWTIRQVILKPGSGGMESRISDVIEAKIRKVWR